MVSLTQDGWVLNMIEIFEFVSKLLWVIIAVCDVLLTLILLLKIALLALFMWSGNRNEVQEIVDSLVPSIFTIMAFSAVLVLGYASAWS